jgi:hypothetical protein
MIHTLECIGGPLDGNYVPVPDTCREIVTPLYHRAPVSIIQDDSFMKTKIPLGRYVRHRVRRASETYHDEFVWMGES